MGRQSRLKDLRGIARELVPPPKPQSLISRFIHVLQTHWLIALILLLISLFGFVTDIRTWLPRDNPPMSVSQEQPVSGDDSVFNPKANIRMIRYSFATGEGLLSIGVVNQGFKPIQNFYVEWWVDASIGTLFAGPKFFPQELPFGGRRMMSFNTYISQAIPPGGRKPIWEMQITNAKKPGIYPMRLVFRSEDRTVTYPESGLDLKGMMIEIVPPKQSR